jgi:hypothetical protein
MGHTPVTRIGKTEPLQMACLEFGYRTALRTFDYYGRRHKSSGKANHFILMKRKKLEINNLI